MRTIKWICTWASVCALSGMASAQVPQHPGINPLSGQMLPSFIPPKMIYQSPKVNLPAPAMLTPTTHHPSSVMTPTDALAEVIVQGEGIVTFGQVFGKGDVPKGKRVGAWIGNDTIPCQIDLKTTYPDGSAKFVIVTVNTGRHGGNSNVVLRRLNSPLSNNSISSISIPDNSLVLNFVFLRANGGNTSRNIDIGSMIKKSLSDSNKPWLQGPLALQIRTDIPIENALHAVVDMTTYADGTMVADIAVDNDKAMGDVGGLENYDISIRWGTRTLLSEQNVMQWQYQDWHRIFRNNGQSFPNILRDIAHIENTGALPRWDTSLQIDGVLLNTEYREMESPHWNELLNGRHIVRYMPMTGGRADIGPATEGNVVWVLSQDPKAALFAQDQAEASGNVPWHMRDAKRNEWIRTDHIPGIWLDDRASRANNEIGLTQPLGITVRGSGWTPDPAHQPDLVYVPYLLTGRRAFLDELQAQAAWCIATHKPSNRGIDGNATMENNQLRGMAWDLRELQEASYISPDNDPMKAYFEKARDANYRWLLASFASHNPKEGDLAGWIPYGGDAKDADKVSLWQEDFMAIELAAGARMGNEMAAEALGKESGFIIGRFIHEAQGFSPRDGVAYNIILVGQDGIPFTTWKQAEEATIKANVSNGKEGWPQSQGYYGQVAMAALAGIKDVVGDPNAALALAILHSMKPPFTDRKTLSHDPTYAIVAVSH
jgi:hypothetical protein